MALWASLFIAAAATAGPTSQPVDPALWKEMTQIDSKVAKIHDVTADFRQEKFTPLLKRPMVSTGRVMGKGSATLWITEKPEPTRMRCDASEIRIYYPRQAMEEVYPLEGQLGTLASSPLPRIHTLVKFFSFEKVPAKSLDGSADDGNFLALRMIPTDPALKDHVKEVKVLLDRRTGFIVRAENTDADEERTVMNFTHVEIDTGMTDDQLKLNVPAGAKISHPLQGLSEQGSSK
jgi:outer membrane lipoprotein-sorting protein